MTFHPSYEDHDPPPRLGFIAAVAALVFIAIAVAVFMALLWALGKAWDFLCWLLPLAWTTASAWTWQEWLGGAFLTGIGLVLAMVAFDRPWGER